MLYFFAFLFGLIIGSLLNCIIYRLEEGKSFLFVRSYCPHCKHNLSWQDLIPAFSFIALRGKCRYCQKPISFQYPLVEMATGLIFVLIFSFQFSAATFYWLISACFLIIIFVFDLKHYIIPDKVIFPAILISAIWYTIALIFLDIYSWQEVLKAFFSAFGAAAFFLLLVLISKGKWMGIGDIKLAFFMGLLTGWPNILVALILAYFIGAIVGIALIFLKKKSLKAEVPFGPFLVAGTFIALFWGEKIIYWYLTFFLIK